MSLCRRPNEARGLVGATFPRAEASQYAVRLALAVLLVAATGAQQAPAPRRLPEDSRIRLAETRRLARAIEDRVWKGWAAAPFAVLLVTDSVEFLVWHPRPSADFQSLGYDSLLGSEVLARPRQYPPTYLATFPAVGGVPTIVAGQPATTGKSSSEWVLTLMHEHFHQLQNSQPRYYAAVDSLQLSHGDQTGMWMLNYAFPYDSAPIQRAFAGLSQALTAALADPSRAALQRYAAARRAVRAALGPEDTRYMDFQLWQEGVARYTEYACARAAARGYTPSAPFAALPDFISYADAATRLRGQVESELSRPDLGAKRRVLFYPLGAATALLLEKTVPRWKDQYFSHLLTLDPEAATIGR